MIDAQLYIKYFASDRSHMCIDNVYTMPVPSYSCISTNESTNNIDLYRYITIEQIQQFLTHDNKCTVAIDDVDKYDYGVIIDTNTLIQWFGNNVI